ncbi:MAG: HAD family hydrolase [Candidatus Woesearchaeota archaeon]
MIKTIFVDFWGTLIEQGVWSPIKHVRTILKMRMPFHEFVVRFEKAMMLKPFIDLREAFHNVGEEFNIDITDREMEELIGMWNKSWMLAKPFSEVEEVLNRLNEKYTLILVANTNKFSLEKVLDKFKLAPYFEKSFLSYQMGLLKTDKDFFPNIIKELNLNIDECVMVGDSIQSDMIAAQTAGLKAILVDRKDKREFDTKINNLKELEQKIAGL